MAMNFGQIGLAVAGGAAEQFVKTQKELREEYKEKKDRQQQWADRYGRKTLDDLTSRSDVVLNAGETLENAGMESANLTQMVNEYDANSILELAKRIEKLSPAEYRKLKESGAINEVLKFKDINEDSSENWADIAIKSFTIPQIEETTTAAEEPTGFFETLKGKMSGADKEDEYQDWYNSTYIEGPDGQEYSIRELRAAPTGILERGKVPDFKLDMFEKDATETSWNRAKSDIYELSVNNISNSGDQDLIDLLNQDESTESGSRSVDSKEALIRNNKRLKPYFDQAVRDVHGQRADAFDTPGGRLFFGGADSLAAILNPMSDEEQAKALLEALNADLEENNLNRENVAEVSTEEEIINHFETTEDSHVIVGGNRLMPRPDGVEFDPKAKKLEGPVVPIDPKGFNEDTFEANTPPTEAAIEARPAASKTRAVAIWDSKYKDKYNNNGTYIIVSPLPTRPNNFFDLDLAGRGKISISINKWKRLYGRTHDKETGFPLVDEVNKSLIPGTPEFQEANQEVSE